MEPLFATKSSKLHWYSGMVDSRNKGAAYERDICKKLNDFFAAHGFDITCKRNLDQYQTADLADIKIPGHAIECKAYKDGWWWRPEWWKQVNAACGNDIPVLVYKFNNKAIRVCLPLHSINPNLPRDNSRTAVITLEEWFALLKEYFDGQREVA
jgi:hypothetical protein